MKRAGLWWLPALFLLSSCAPATGASETAAPQVDAAPPTFQTAGPASAPPVPSAFAATPPPAPSAAALQIPFKDKFDDGMSPYWRPLKGNWKVVDGKLTADPSDDWSMILIGQDDWADYVVDVDVFAYSRDYPIGIVVRANAGNYLIYQATCCNTEMVLVQGKARSVLSEISQIGLQYVFSTGPTANRFHIEVYKQRYVAYSTSAILIQSIQNAALQSGQVGIAFRAPIEDTPRFDNFTITAP